MKTDNSTHEYFIRLKESESRMDTHEVRVSLETAKMLQRVGFDWECEYAILPTTEMGDKAYRYNKGKSHNYNNKEAYQFEIYSAPTLDVAQRWLREIKHCFVNVNIDVDDNECEDTIVVAPFTCKYIIEGFPYCNNSTGDDYIRNTHGDCEYFNIYEEAQEAGIKKVLEIILERGE